MTKQTSNTKTYVQDDVQTIKMTKQTSNSKTCVQDDVQNNTNDETN